jgi:predicted transcriptional regulator
MADFGRLSRRERQILDILYTRDGATVLDVAEELPDPPTPMAVRRLLQILEEKGFVTRRKVGREYLYLPRRPKRRAGIDALQHVLDTFFGGSLDEALAAHFEKKERPLGREEIERMERLIEEARRKGR